MGVIVFNGVSSTVCGLRVEKPPVYAFPERDYSVVHIPGRNGDIVVDSGSYKNTTRSYDVSFGEFDGNFTELASKVSEWLHSASGYARLEDSYEPDYFRLAYYIQENEFENIFHKAGRMTIEFSCKPGRYLKTGETTVTFTSAGVLKNPTLQTALPKIKIQISGDGTMTIGGRTVTITGIESSTAMIIDSELQDVFEENSLTNLNAKVAFSDRLFPTLTTGLNAISFTGAITSVEVTPRWWIL